MLFCGFLILTPWSSQRVATLDCYFEFSTKENFKTLIIR